MSQWETEHVSGAGETDNILDSIFDEENIKPGMEKASGVRDKNL